MNHTSYHASTEAGKLEQRRLDRFLREANRDSNILVMLPDETADSKARKKAAKKAMKKKMKKIMAPLATSSSGHTPSSSTTT